MFGCCSVIFSRELIDVAHLVWIKKKKLKKEEDDND